MTSPAAGTDSARPAVEIDHLSYRYGQRLALDRVSFQVHEGEIFGLLGPNGGGKTTLFRILATLAMPDSGSARICGLDLEREQARIRACVGVVFQNASIDPMLSVRENLDCHGRLFGLRGGELSNRVREVSAQLGLSDRADERCATLSGGLKRRVELAKGLLPQPRLLILDEPSAALDPGARRDLWRYLKSLQTGGTTILVTTHLLEEAEHCDRIAILDRGNIVALGNPETLRGAIGGDILTIHTSVPDELSALIIERFGETPLRVGETLRMEKQDGHRFLLELVDEFSAQIDGVSVGKPTLEDVFVRETGHRFWGESQ